MDKYTIPRLLDEPFKIALLTIGEIAALVLPILTGLYLYNAPVVGLLFGVAMVVLLKKLKGREGHRFIYHLAYWHLPQLIRFRSTPPSHMREILG
jgi:type IV conjugative transfer system protein TraL